MSELITPFTAPRAPDPEPEAVLQFGDIEVRLTLTYLHHLVNCQGWGDRQSSFFESDAKMQEAMKKIEQAMWNALDRANRPGDQ